MAEVSLKRPVVIYFYGFPGAGKSYIAKNLEQLIPSALISDDKIRYELFEVPQFGEQENQIVNYVMDYMAEQFLRAGVSVIYDVNALRTSQRRGLKSMASEHKAEHLLIWIQIDPESAFARTQSRDRRRGEDKYATEETRQSFEGQLSQMQNPKNEDYLVISGKHSFITQKSAVLNRLYQMGLIETGAVQSNIAKPGLINLVPTQSAGRVDLSRRNINIS